jgi:CDP-diacylglycerol--glycerol-3-phosphate 3-phosphatidyltransferase
MLPSFLSLLRVPLAVVGVISVLKCKGFWTVLIVGFAALTDFLDGLLARRLQKTSKVGAHMDHITDKIFVLSLLWAFVLTGKVYNFLFLLLLLREVGITFLRFWGIAKPVGFGGKVKTAVEYLALAVLPFEFKLGNALLVLAVVLAYISGFLYVRENLAGFFNFGNKTA